MLKSMYAVFDQVSETVYDMFCLTMWLMGWCIGQSAVRFRAEDGFAGYQEGMSCCGRRCAVRWWMEMCGLDSVFIS